MTTAQALSWVAAAVQRPGRTVLGVTGPPGSGKSTLASALHAHAEQMRPGSAVVVGMDGWHLAHSVLLARGLADRKGAPETFDAAGYLATLRRIRARQDEPVWVPEFRRDIEDAVAGAVAVLPEHRLVITEGNYLLLATDPWQQVRRALAECWYVEVPQEARLHRLADRHQRFGRAREQAEYRARVVDEANAVLVAQTRARADAVVTEGRRPARPDLAGQHR